MGEIFTAAAIQMSYGLVAADERVGLDRYANIKAWLKRIKARPGYAEPEAPKTGAG